MVRYDDLIGVPFINNGRSRAGYDCYGLVMEVYRRHGIMLPEYTADFNDAEKISAIIDASTKQSCWHRVVPNKLAVPTVLVIRFGVPKGWVNHTGVYIGNGRFIHTRDSVGVCIDRIDSPAWRHCIEGFFEYRENGGDQWQS